MAFNDPKELLEEAKAEILKQINRPKPLPNIYIGRHNGRKCWMRNKSKTYRELLCSIQSGPFPIRPSNYKEAIKINRSQRKRKRRSRVLPWAVTIFLIFLEVIIVLFYMVGCIACL